MNRPPSSSQPIPVSTSGRSGLDVAIDAARRAGKVILDRYHTQKEISFKGRADVVSDVDLLAEKAVLELVQEEYPSFGVLSEESAPVASKSGYTWVVDPLDGTRNYVMGVPHFCVVVALALQEDVLLGVTYDPVREEMFVAEKGKGAYVNDVPMEVSQKQEITDCTLGFDMGYVDEKAGIALDMVRALWPGIQGLRLMGSAALGAAYAASGRTDIYFHHHLSPWDIASGLLLVSEAGGYVVDRHGQPATLFPVTSSDPSSNADSASPQGSTVPGGTSIIASSPQLIDRFLAATEGLEWRGG